MQLQTLPLTTADFDRLSKFIFSQYGIKMNALKKTMLESRLQKRLQTLNLSSYSEYCHYLFSSEGQASELIPLVNVVTTNKTDFFREAGHFEFLTRFVLPQISDRSPLRLWSAGCSSGEEPYTLAMVISEFAQTYGMPVPYSILGTDLSTKVLEMASNAVYTPDRIAMLPLGLRKKYFLRSKDTSQPASVRVAAELRQKVSFQQLNFMDSSYQVAGHFDVVFCRNVLIYFDKVTQEKVINRLCAKLKEGGFFFLGHSESITNMNVPLEQIRPTIFRKI